MVSKAEAISKKAQSSLKEKIIEVKKELSKNLVKPKDKQDASPRLGSDSTSEKAATALLAEIQKLSSNFTYLRKPWLMPKSYEESLVEIKRRTVFRHSLESTVGQIKKMIESEKSKR